MFNEKKRFLISWRFGLQEVGATKKSYLRGSTCQFACTNEVPLFYKLSKQNNIFGLIGSDKSFATIKKSIFRRLKSILKFYPKFGYHRNIHKNEFSMKNWPEKVCFKTCISFIDKNKASYYLLRNNHTSYSWKALPAASFINRDEDEKL
jgi:hypothetical protein